MDSWLAYIRRIAPTTAALLVVAGLLLGVATAMGMVGFHYPHVIRDQPMTNPVGVLKVEGNLLYLANDRVVYVDRIDATMLAAMITDSGYEVDLRGEDGDQSVYVFSRQSGGLCGTPWAQQPIRIPLIRDDVYVNRVNMLGLGTYIDAPATPDTAPAE